MTEPETITCPPPELWTSWRDRRDDTVVTVVGVAQWGSHIAASPPGGQGSVRVEVEGAPRWKRMQRVDEWDWPNFELVYDPMTD